MSGPGELVALVAAMHEEIAPLEESLSAVEEISEGPYRFVRGRLRGIPVVLAVTGEGKRNADLRTRHLVQRCAPTRLLALGLGGALSPELCPGDLVVSSEVLEGGAVLGWPDLQWLAEAEPRTPHLLGRVVTVDEILLSPELKQHWWAQTPRDQPAVADMESACVARVALAYGLPYLVVRAVSDGADEQLPAFLEDCRSEDGAIDRRQVVWRALWRPSSWQALTRLRRRLERSAEDLAQIAEELVTAVA